MTVAAFLRCMFCRVIGLYLSGAPVGSEDADTSDVSQLPKALCQASFPLNR